MFDAPPGHLPVKWNERNKGDHDRHDAFGAHAPDTKVAKAFERYVAEPADSRRCTDGRDRGAPEPDHERPYPPEVGQLRVRPQVV